MKDLKSLRKNALSQTLFPPISLKQAIHQLGFVQADPIRSPARAQDLILRHRVKGYISGDLAKNYESLDIEEDFLYAHGFLHSSIWQLLHPRKNINLTSYDKKVLTKVRQLGKIHPKDLGKHFQKKQELNWWGGYSQSAKMSLDRLHYYGLLKVAGRKNGIRVYTPTSSTKNSFTLEARLEKIIISILNLLSPATEKTLNQSLHRIRRHFGPTKPSMTKMLKEGKLFSQKINGVNYIYLQSHNGAHGTTGVKFLSPFDPVVWDRARFEHIWGWRYRFEAYVPKNKRIRGYYAMPLLWQDDMIGWVNVDKKGDVDIGYINGQVNDKKFKTELAIEIEKMRIFLDTSADRSR